MKPLPPLQQKLHCTRLILGYLLIEAIFMAFIDRPLASYLHQLDQAHQALIDIFRGYTDIGKSKWYLIASAAGAALAFVTLRLSRNPTFQARAAALGPKCLIFFLALAASGLFADLLKWLIGRSRPILWNQDGIYSLHPFATEARWQSLPSGHAVTGFMIALMIARLMPRIRVPIFIFALAIATSRVMVNAHFLSDAAAGYGIAWLTGVALRSTPIETRLQKALDRLYRDRRKPASPNP